MADTPVIHRSPEQAEAEGAFVNAYLVETESGALEELTRAAAAAFG
jgi:hypothetical protein